MPDDAPRREGRDDRDRAGVAAQRAPAWPSEAPAVPARPTAVQCLPSSRPPFLSSPGQAKGPAGRPAPAADARPGAGPGRRGPAGPPVRRRAPGSRRASGQLGPRAAVRRPRRCQRSRVRARRVRRLRAQHAARPGTGQGPCPRRPSSGRRCSGAGRSCFRRSCCSGQRPGSASQGRRRHPASPPGRSIRCGRCRPPHLHSGRAPVPPALPLSPAPASPPVAAGARRRRSASASPAAPASARRQPSPSAASAPAEASARRTGQRPCAGAPPRQPPASAGAPASVTAASASPVPRQSPGTRRRRGAAGSGQCRQRRPPVRLPPLLRPALRQPLVLRRQPRLPLPPVLPPPRHTAPAASPPPVRDTPAAGSSAGARAAGGGRARAAGPRRPAHGAAPDGRAGAEWPGGPAQHELARPRRARPRRRRAGPARSRQARPGAGRPAGRWLPAGGRAGLHGRRRPDGDHADGRRPARQPARGSGGRARPESRPGLARRLAAPRPVLPVGSLLAGRAGRVARLRPGARRQRPPPRGRGQLDVFVPEVRGDGALDMGDLQYRRVFDAVAAGYGLTLADPGAAAVARVLAVADQLVLVAPASPDAARALAMTQEWLGAHGYEALAANSITVVNGLSKRSMPHAEQAELVVRGRCRAIVRVPWDDHLAEPQAERGIRDSLDPARRVPARAAAPTGPAGLHGAGRGAGRRAGRQPAAAAGGQMSGRTRGRSRLSVRYFDDRILLTETHAWAYYRLPTQPYEFTTPLEREALATNITVALAAIRMPDAEAHLRIAHRPYPAAEWAARLDATSDGGPGWRDYLDEMYRHVWAKDFWTKEVYLGVRLGQRGMRAQLSGGMFSQFINAYRGWRAGAGPGRRGGQRRARSPAGPSRPSGSAARWASSALAAQHATSRRDRLAVPAHADGHGGRPAAVGGRTAAVGGRGDRVRCSKARCRTGAPCSGWSTRPVSRSRRSCPSPGSPTSCRSPRGAVAALRRLAAVPGRGQLPDEADPAGQGQQGRRPQAGARPGHGRAHQGGGRGRCRSRWPSRSRRPGCWSTASPRNGCRLSTAGTGCW